MTTAPDFVISFSGAHANVDSIQWASSACWKSAVVM